MLDFFREMMEDAPLASILPLAVSEIPPESWLDMDGRDYDADEYPEFFDALKSKLEYEPVRTWWESLGGSQTSLPNVPSDEAYAAAFGIDPGQEELKLVIKVKNG